MAPWKLPLVVTAIAVPIVAGFLIGGPGLGAAVGALAALVLVVVAVRQQPRTEIGEAPRSGVPHRLLVVTGSPVEDAAAIAAIAAAAIAPGGKAEVMVLAPVRIGFLDRWASDLEGARTEAQRNLVITVASLAKVGVEAEARVGDEDLVQAVEDATRSFAANEVILVGPRGEGFAAAGQELEARLRAPLRRLYVE
ncbi:MAG: hypothetical protein R2725_09905 [Solirubrobacterales bacterium]